MTQNKIKTLLTTIINPFNHSHEAVSGEKLSKLLGIAARKYNVPGIAVGVVLEGKVTYAQYGVTSTENPEPVDENTLFMIASVTKTFTATTIMRLVAEEKIDLHAPIKKYIPKLKLKDQEAAGKITVLNLLNHTSGLDWRLEADTGEGDDALEKLVAKMAEVIK